MAGAWRPGSPRGVEVEHPAPPRPVAVPLPQRMQPVHQPQCQLCSVPGLWERRFRRPQSATAIFSQVEDEVEYHRAPLWVMDCGG